MLFEGWCLMNIHIFKTNEQVNAAGAELIISLIRQQPHAVLGAATGSTPIGIYEQLVSSYRSGLVSFRGVTTFNLDEYVGLPHEHPESYHSYMKRHLFGHIDIEPQHTHIPNGMADDLEAECARYDQLLARAKQIDLQILGLGHNGHIGFNEPATSLVSGTHIVPLKEETRQANARFFPSIDDVPTHALTMGVGSILKAKSILLVVRGADKADIVQQALTGPITTECPASLLQTHPSVIVLLDSEAGRHLT